MKTRPFLKGLSSLLLILFGVPFQHIVVVLYAYALTESFDDEFWAVEEVVGVHNADFNSGLAVSVAVRIANFVPTLVAPSRLGGDDGSHLANGAQIVENATDLVVASFGGHEVIEACKLVERRDRAAIIGWDAVARMADQENKMELVQDLRWHDRGVSGLGVGSIGIWRAFRPVQYLIWGAADVTVRPRTNTSFLPSKRWGD